MQSMIKFKTLTRPKVKPIDWITNSSSFATNVIIKAQTLTRFSEYTLMKLAIEHHT